jgi:capsular polysaccharide biosynthesis protein
MGIPFYYKSIVNKYPDVVNKNKNAQFEANKYVTSGQKAIDEQKAVDEEATADKILATAPSSTAPKSNTGLYIGIGVGVLAIGTIAFLLIRKK